MIHVLMFHSSKRYFFNLQDVIDTDKVDMSFATTPEHAIDTFYTSKKSFELLIFDVIKTAKADCYPGIMAAGIIHNDYPGIHLIFLCDQNEMINVNNAASKENISSHELIFYDDRMIENLKRRIQSFYENASIKLL